MIKHGKLIALCAAVAAALLIAAAMADVKGLDVVGRYSVDAFGKILTSLPDGAAAEGAGWSLRAPDGAARFVWGADAALLEWDAEPFLKAGLDPEKLPDAYTFSESADGKAALSFGTAPQGTGTAASAVDAYGSLVDARRDAINYHSFLDHFGVKVGGGNMFEWAKDRATNRYDGTTQDKDIVFALNPAPLAAAGVDPEKVAGWVHAEVPVMTGGTTGTEWNLLKPFDLE